MPQTIKPMGLIHKAGTGPNNRFDFINKANNRGNETKEAPPGTYFTRTGNLVKGRLTKAAKSKGARETDPKDNQRSKVPPVTQRNEARGTCWHGYQQKGYKKKGNRMVPNCVPEVKEKKMSAAQLKKREEIAKAIEKDNPDMPMDKKMAIATAKAKEVAEKGLWDNIRAKRARGEKMRKKGEKGAPTQDQIKRAQGEQVKEKIKTKQDSDIDDKKGTQPAR